MPPAKNNTHTNGAVVMSNGTKPKQLGGCTGKGFMPGKSGNPEGKHISRNTRQFGELCRDWLFDQEWVKDLQGRKLHKQMRLKTVMQRLAEQKPEVLLHYAFGKPVEMVQLTQAEGAPIEFVVKVRGEDLP